MQGLPERSVLTRGSRPGLYSGALSGLVLLRITTECQRAPRGGVEQLGTWYASYKRIIVTVPVLKPRRS